MNITIIGAKLDCGGVQRSITIKANYWTQKGWKVTLLTLDDDTSPPFFELDPRINLIPLGIYQASSNLLSAVWNNLRRIIVLRRAIHDSKPDVVISFWTFVSVLVLLGTRGLGVPVVVSEEGDPLSDPPSRVLKWLRRWTYTFGTKIVVLTERAKACFHGKVEAKTTVIPNAVALTTHTVKMLPDEDTSKLSIVAMGRFSREKGFDILLRAFVKLKDIYPNWTLTIAGDGPLHTQIESLRDELGLEGRIHLPGLVKNPHQILKQADLFVLSSRWEGWPYVLLEAMSCGLPVISTDCRTGPSEMIRDGVDGVLVPPEDVEALAAAMDRLMSDESKRERLGSRALDVNERFPLDKVMGMWEEVLRTVVHS